MLIGEERVRETADRLLAQLDDAVDGHELAEVDEVLVVVAVSYGPVDEEGEREAFDLLYRCTSARMHVQLGLLENTRRAMEQSVEKEDE